MATHSTILAWKIPWTEGPLAYSPRGHKEWDMTEQLRTHTHTHTHILKRNWLNETRELEEFPEWNILFTIEDISLTLFNKHLIIYMYHMLYKVV